MFPRFRGQKNRFRNPFNIIAKGSRKIVGALDREGTFPMEAQRKRNRFPLKMCAHVRVQGGLLSTFDLDRKIIKAISRNPGFVFFADRTSGDNKP